MPLRCRSHRFASQNVQDYLAADRPFSRAETPSICPSWATATVETVAVFLATAVVLSHGATALGTVVGLPLGVVRVAIKIVAFGATYVLVAGDWSVGVLGAYFFAFVASTIVGLGAGAAVLAIGIVGVPVDESLVRLGLWCLVYVVAGGAIASGVTGRGLSR